METFEAVTDLSIFYVEEGAIMQQANLNAGLTEDKTAELLLQFGPNQLTEIKARSIWNLTWDQLKSPIVYLLLVVTGVLFFFSKYLNANAILVVILINTVVGFMMEYQAGKFTSLLIIQISILLKLIQQ